MMKFRDKIQLKDISAADREAFFEWRNDPSIWYWCRQHGPIQRAIHDSYWYEVSLCQDKKFFSIVADDETIGCAGLTSIDYVNSRAEFSLYIGPENQGNGFAKPALSSLFDYGFAFLNLNSIWGETFDGNPALAIFKSLGMEFEGTRKQFYYRDGKYIDAHLVSIQKDKWDTQKLQI